MTTDIRSITFDEAYEIQEKVIAERIAEGETHVGYKVGCTSRAIQSQFGLEEPISGHLMEPHIHPDPAKLDIGSFVDCAVEPEFVLHIGSDLEVNAVSAGIELHNYRFVHGEPISPRSTAASSPRFTSRTKWGQSHLNEPSGPRTAGLSNRWTGELSNRSEVSSTIITRPLVAPKSTAATNRFMNATV